MHYSEIKKHIISKRYYWIYITIVLISLILVFFSLYSSTLALLFFWLSTISVSCIAINLYRCRSFYKFYQNSLKEYHAQFIRIEIQKEDYKMQMPYKSYNTTISPFPKLTNAVYIEEGEFIMLFFSIQYLGLLQLVLKPLIFVKTEKEFYIKDKKVNLIKKFEILKNEQNRIIVFPNKNGIKKIMIPIQ